MEPRPRSHGNATLGPSVNIMSSPKLRATKRPNTTPKLRIQKILSVPHKEATDCLSNDTCEVFFMTNLPDSPPKLDVQEHVYKTQTSSTESREDIAPAPDEMTLDNNPNSTELTTQNYSEQTIALTRIHAMEPQSAMNDVSTENPETNDGESSADDQCMDGQYAQWILQMQSIEASRAQLIEELNGYVESLHNKNDEAGESLVMFPDNYDDVLALMTEKDGIIDGEDNPTELNMKIARGIAKIRKNDMILESLNIKVKSSSGPLAKCILSESIVNPTLPKRTRCNSAQRIKEKVEAAKSIDTSSVASVPTRGEKDFIAKNKEMKLAGKNLTQAEEARALALLNDLGDNTDLTQPIADKAYKPLHDEQEMLELRRENSVATLSESIDIPPTWKDNVERYKQERLNTIEATLQAYRDEDNGIGAVGDDDCISFSSGYSRRTSISGVRYK
ncbi:hypothetical protein THRCLA_03346 [Thraustotheca clavata]|uniref:Uncharacterized protein n=1 Tax=Thraustotheca clavata TaxID=74557 RepID=A0A1W0A2I2_9STRA|nr:hypothetical protein THRCLA_03346 [Thraustotheca clavata]